MISALVYLLCTLTSTLCTALLYRSYLRNRTSLLLWSSICFLGLALNNALVFVDLEVMPQVNLSIVRTLPAFLGLAALIWGFVWDIP